MLNIAIREMWIKTTMRYHFTPVRMAIIKKCTNNKCWRGCGLKGTFLHCWWECKLVQPLWKTVWRFLKKTKNRVTIWSSNPTPGHISGKDENSNSERYVHTNVHSSTIYNSKDMEATQVSINRWIDTEDVAYMKYYSAIKKNEILPSAAI